MSTCQCVGCAPGYLHQKSGPVFFGKRSEVLKTARVRTEAWNGPLATNHRGSGNHSIAILCANWPVKKKTPRDRIFFLCVSFANVFCGYPILIHSLRRYRLLARKRKFSTWKEYQFHQEVGIPKTNLKFFWHLVGIFHAFLQVPLRNQIQARSPPKWGLVVGYPVAVGQPFICRLLYTASHKSYCRSVAFSTDGRFCSLAEMALGPGLWTPERHSNRLP